MSVDTLGSAGPSAQIPSRVGKLEVDTILGSTHPNGSSLSNPLSPLSDSDDPTLDSSPGGGSMIDAITGEKILEDGFDINHERYYGPRRTAALVVLLIVLGGLGWIGLRWRRRKRLADWHKRGGSPGSRQSSLRSVGSKGWKGKGRASGGTGIRLDDWESQYSRAGTTDDDEDDGSERRVARKIPESTTVFDVGDDEEDTTEGEEEDEDAWGDLGRQADQWGEEGDSKKYFEDEEKGVRS